VFQYRKFHKSDMPRLVYDTLGPVAPALQMRMRSICSAMWILGALLFLFTLKNTPDPLATIHMACQSHTACPHSVALENPAMPVNASVRLHLQRAAGDVTASYSYPHTTIAIDFAANLSPPSFRYLFAPSIT
jgi:hypothetical protein